MFASTGNYNKELVDAFDAIQGKESKKKKKKKKKAEIEITLNETSEYRSVLDSSPEPQLQLKNENSLNVPYRDRTESTATFASDIAYAESIANYNKELVDVLDPIQEKPSKKKKKKKKNKKKEKEKLIEMPSGYKLMIEDQEHDSDSLPKPKYDLDRDLDLTYGEVV
jgi:hypothetical protein